MAWVVIDRDGNEKRFANKPILRVRNEGTCDEVCSEACIYAHASSGYR